MHNGCFYCRYQKLAKGKLDDDMTEYCGNPNSSHYDIKCRIGIDEECKDFELAEEFKHGRITARND